MLSGPLLHVGLARSKAGLPVMEQGVGLQILVHQLVSFPVCLETLTIAILANVTGDTFLQVITLRSQTEKK